MRKIPFSKLCIFIAVALYIGAVMVIVITSAYTIYNTDDFMHAYKVGIEKPSFVDNLYASFQIVRDLWKTAGGVYFSYFLMMFFSPLNNGGEIQLRVIMVVCTIFFALIAGLFLCKLFKKQESQASKYLLLASICFWSFCNYKAWPEVFFWFSGAMGYEVSLGCLLAMILTFSQWCATRKRRWFWITLALGFCVMGTNLVIAFVTGYLMLLELCREIYHKTITLNEVIMFIVLGCFFAINGFAPGNFVRATGYTAATNANPLVMAVVYSFRTFVIESERFFKDTGFVIFFLIALIIGFSGKASYEKRLVFRPIIILSVSIAAVFPAALGYKSPYMPNRVLFVSDFFLIVGYIYLAFQLGKYFSKTICDDGVIKKRCQIIAGLVVFIICCVMPYRIEDGVVYRLAKSLCTKEIPSYYEEIMGVLDKIEDSTQADVVIDEIPEDIESYMNFWISDDPEYFANREIAAYFGKESIRASNDPR